MGYTHYFYRAPKLDLAKFKLASDDCKKLAETLPIPLGDGCGEGKPTFDDESVVFNGHVDSGSFSRDAGSIPWPAPKAEGLATVGQTAKVGQWFAGDVLGARAVSEDGNGSYETFGVDRDVSAKEHSTEQGGLVFDCCKTAFRPYDLVVRCCLIIFDYYFGQEFEVSSDGDDEHWNEARDACQSILGYGITFQLDD